MDFIRTKKWIVDTSQTKFFQKKKLELNVSSLSRTIALTCGAITYEQNKFYHHFTANVRFSFDNSFENFSVLNIK